MLWQELASASRFLLYVCTAITLGALFCTWLSRQHRLSPPLSRPLLALVYGLGAFSVISSYLLLVGSIAMAGFWGMFERELLQFLLPDAAGKALQLQLPAFVLMALSLLMQKTPKLSRLLQGLALMLLLVGFLQGGHLQRFGLTGQLLLLVHLVCIGLWVGSLPLLWRLCQRSPAAQLHALLHQFGQIMVGVLVCLILSGVSMLWLLVSEPSQLWSTSYGRWLLAKLLLVALLLGLGALNKLRLVPELKRSPNPQRLKHAIAAEMLLACLILAITAVLTVVIGWSA